MFFNAAQASGAIGAVVPEKSAHSAGPGQQHNLNPQQFPGKGKAPGEATGAEAGAGEAAGAAGAAEGGASVAELLPLLAL